MSNQDYQNHVQRQLDELNRCRRHNKLLVTSLEKAYRWLKMLANGDEISRTQVLLEMEKENDQLTLIIRELIYSRKVGMED